MHRFAREFDWLYMFKVALYTILQRFEYHICILNNFSAGKFLSQGAFGRRSIIKAYSARVQNPNDVAMATTDRDAWLVF